VSARGAARIQRRHPWIYRDDVKGGRAHGADTVLVVDDKRRPLASAFFAEEPAPIALRVYAHGETFVPFDEALFADRLERAAARRKALFHGVAHRWVHAEADLLPGLFVDLYGDAAVVQSATAAMDRRLPDLGRLLTRRFGLRLVVRRDDGSLRDHEGLPRTKERLAGAGSPVVTYREGKVTFELDLLEDAKTGAFLDQRDNHVSCARLAKGEALDAFTYHGGFALALAERSEAVLGLDQDPRAIERAQRNAVLSGLLRVEFRVADAFGALRELEAQGRRFDVVVVDPPALAKRGGVPAALRAYQELNVRALRITKKDGVLVTCSCSGKVTPALFGDMLTEAARLARREVAIVARHAAGPDHPVLLGVPETDYLKCWVLEVM
jgi:23S rRNA (cytosine1962-C5)-methyltransferase